MHGLSPVDPGRVIDWSRSSADYAVFRPGPLDSFYPRLADFGVGLSGQRILDLGTGTGVLARRFAQQGARVAGIDISDGQLAEARRLDPSIDFRLEPAEATSFPAASFDILTANQCWFYFEAPRAIAEARRLAVRGGLLVTSHFSWLPRLDPIARASEELVLRHNPAWTAGDWHGEIPTLPDWARNDFRLRGMFVYDEPIPFTRRTWRGRIRACRGIGASLPEEEVARFDAEHEKLLRSIAPEEFTVLHRLDAHVLEIR